MIMEHLAANPTHWLTVLDATRQQGDDVMLTRRAQLQAGRIFPTYHGRVVAVAPDRVILQVDEDDFADRTFAVDATVRLNAGPFNSRHEMLCLVADSIAHDGKREIHLEAPARIEVAPSRRHERICPGGDEEVIQLAPVLPVSFEPRQALDPEEELRIEEAHLLFGDHCPASPNGFTARLANISEGGIGLVAEADIIEVVMNNTLYTCHLTLPGFFRRMEIPARVLHLHVQPPDACSLGVQFEFFDYRNRRQCSRQIQRFSQWMRSQLAGDLTASLDDGDIDEEDEDLL